MNSATNSPLSSSSVDTDEHDNIKEHGNLVDAENTTVLNTSQEPHNTVTPNNIDTRYHETDNETQVRNDHLTDGNTPLQLQEAHDNNTLSQNNTQSEEETRDNNIQTEEFQEKQTSSDTAVLNKTESSEEENKTVSETIPLENHSNTENEVKEKDDNREPPSHQGVSYTTDSPYDQPVEAPVEALENVTEDKFNRDDIKSVPDNKDAPSLQVHDDLIDKREDIIPSSHSWHDSTTLSEPDTRQDTSAIGHKNEAFDDNLSSSYEKVAIEEENETRDTFPVSASEHDIRESFSLSAREIETLDKAKTDNRLDDDDTLIPTEKLAINDDNDTRVPGDIETYKTDDMVINDGFNHTEKYVLDDNKDIRETHTLPEPETETYQLGQTALNTHNPSDNLENQFVSNDTLIHEKAETHNDTNKEPHISDDTLSIDKNSTRYDEERVTHDYDKEAKAVELENVQKNQALLDDELTNLSPGVILQRTREQQKFSVKHIADRLYLDVHVIEALEADDYETLPPTIFIRGYLRNYAKLLDIPVKSLMTSFDQLQQPTMMPVFNTPSKPKKQASSRDLLPTIGTFAVFITLILGVALWKFYPNTNFNSQLTVDPTSAETFPTMIGPLDEPTSFNGDETNIIDETLVVANNSSNPDNDDLNDSQKDEEQVAPEPTLQTMQVRFKERSWMKISDKTGKKLYEGTGNAGEILPLEGTQPFYLHVGNADGVSVEYNGEIKDIINYPRQRKNRRVFIVGNND